MPCVTAAASDLQQLTRAVQADPTLRSPSTWPNKRCASATGASPRSMPDGPREQLASGRWDTTGELLEGAADVAKTASALRYFSAWR